MIGLDTNVLVRYIVQDDPQQTRKATRWIEGSCTEENPGFIAHVVLCELVWVLTSAYRYPKPSVVGVLEQILRIAQLRVEDPELAWLSVNDYRRSNADFSDHLIGRLNAAHGCAKTITFNRSAESAAGFELIR